jgi:sugar lactone lactonase YvrE
MQPIRRYTSLIWIFLLAALVLPASREALAQSAYSANPLTLPSGSGFSDPVSVAVDASGDVFVADSNHNAVKEIPYSNGVYQTPVTLPSGSGSAIPEAVAVDASGDVFVADYNNAVKEIPYSNGAYQAPVTLPNGSGFSYPQGLAVDASGNVFVGDAGNNAVKEIPYSKGAYQTPITLPSGTGFAYPSGVAVDASGNVFVADEGNSVVKEIPYSNGADQTPVTLSSGTGFAYPTGVAVDTSGDVFVADEGNQAVKEILPQSFASTALGSTASTQVTVNFAFTAGGVIQAPAVLTQGAMGLDFTDTGTGTCTTNGTSYSYSAGDTCTVIVSFTPTRPGARNGAVVLDNSSGGVIATGYISGAGSGPLVTFSPYTRSTLTGGIANPEGMAGDGNGNLFVAAGTAVYELAYANGSFSAPVSLLSTYGGTALNSTQWVTVDGAGNVLVADGGNSRILKLSPGSGGSYTASEICSSGCDGNEIAVDGSGNVYTLSAGAGAIVEETLANGAYTAGTISLSDANNPWSIVVDAAGDIFYSTQGDGCLREIPSGGLDTQIDCSLDSPQGMAIDLAGNLYLSETIGDVVEYQLSGGTYTKVATPLITGLTNSTGLWVDAYDNLFVSDTGGGKVYKFDYADAPTLSFASTQVGSTSSSNPQTVTVLNAGNAALTLTHPNSGSNPSFSSGFAYDSASTCDTTSAAYTLAAGSSCTLAVDFDPVAVGSPVTGTATLTDNALNVSGSTQAIPLSGIAPQGSQTISFANPGSQTVVTPLTLSATSTSGLTVSFASSTTSVCTVSGSTATFLSIGTCTLTASQAGNTNYAAAADVSQSFTVNTASQTINFTAPTSPVTYGVSPITLSASAGSGLAVTFSVVSGPGVVSGSTLTVTGVGTIVIAANQAGNSAYAAAPQVRQSIVVARATPTISWAMPSTITYGTALGSALDAAATLSGTPIAGTYSYTATVTGGASTGVTNATILPAGSYSLSVTFVPTDTTHYTTATGSTTLIVAKATPVLSIAGSAGTLLLDNPVTFTATLTSSAGTPTGSVSFLDGSTALGASTLSSGVATFTTTGLTTGSHTIAAVYAGDSNFSSATSASLIETVQDFDIWLNTAGGSSTSASVAPGQSAVYSLMLSPIGSTVFPATVELSASGLPTGAAVNFSPASLAAGTGSSTVTMTIQLPQATAATRPDPFRRPWLPVAPAALALCLLPFASRLRRAIRTLVVAILLLAAAGGMAALSGCGSASGFFGQPQQTYTITVTGTSGALVHSTTVSLTVQ